jgi:dTDP-4-dehydrorhamnose reductase
VDLRHPSPLDLLIAVAMPASDAVTVLLFGPTGQIGHELRTALAPPCTVVPVGRDRADLAEPRAVRAVVQEETPDVVINAAAYTDVDGAEAAPETAHAVNAKAPGVIAEAARDVGAWVVHYSTDYVFDGTATAPYHEDDPTNPLSVYARTKRDGEEAVRQAGARHLLLRTSWAYSDRRTNFLRTMLRLADERDQLRVVDDQIGCPTWAGWIAQATASMLKTVRTADNPETYSGLYHLCSSGQTSWYGFARAIFARFEREVAVEPISTDAYPTNAPRPAYSALDTQRVRTTFGLDVPTWSAQLAALHARSTSPPPDASTETGAAEANI